MWPATQSMFVWLLRSRWQQTDRHITSLFFSLSLGVSFFLLIINDLATEHIYMQNSA
jgi:hypothetical protein